MSKFIVLRERKVLPIPVSRNGVNQTSENTKKIHGVNLFKCWQYFKSGFLTQFYLQENWDKTSDFLKNRCLEDKKYVPEVYKKQLEFGHELVSFSKEILRKSLSDHSLNELYGLYNKIISACNLYEEYNVLSWFVGGDKLRDYAFKTLSDSHQDLSESNFNLLITPPEKSFGAKEELAILQATLDKMNGLNIEKKINELVDKYYWIPFGYDGPTLNDKKHYLNEIQDCKKKSKEQIENRIKELENYEKNIKNQQQTLFDKFNLSDQEKFWISELQLFSLMTDQRKEFTFQAQAAFDKVLKEIARRLKIEKNLLKYISFEELGKYLNDTDKIKELARERTGQAFVFLGNQGKLELLSREETRKLEKEIFSQIDETEIIKGNIGSHGNNPTVTAKVKVLMSPEEINKMSEGEILVATMTSPEYIPAMRKAIAIVTDEGGITCHAAIVSRELNIPCIIATKIATKVLKDGDMVEVDANKGVVRIIE